MKIMLMSLIEHFHDKKPWAEVKVKVQTDGQEFERVFVMDVSKKVTWNKFLGEIKDTLVSENSYRKNIKEISNNVRNKFFEIMKEGD